ncbi:hypothetical protein EVAR_56956_1 [Eumeta japonica]|uniref:Uncharacterized protein n=1 Tax=Eumeta variegata TaxID=151549 RepID=A0A4C1YPZ8_EUMVA|nr:hypothetical protein EVAR_56956_1 [Eumeta japonica]
MGPRSELKTGPGPKLRTELESKTSEGTGLESKEERGLRWTSIDIKYEGIHFIPLLAEVWTLTRWASQPQERAEKRMPGHSLYMNLTARGAHCTMMCGADHSTATVAMIVNSVNTNRQNLQSLSRSLLVTLGATCASAVTAQRSAHEHATH